MTATVIKGNKREVPEGIAPTDWWNTVLEREANRDSLPPLPFWNPLMEYLSLAELVRVQAKVRVWEEVTGEYPEEIDVWWEVRCARKRGDAPHREDVVEAKLAVHDDAEILVCGHCSARWTPPYRDRCGLCDTKWILPRGVEAWA